MNKRWKRTISVLLISAAIVIIGLVWKPWVHKVNALTPEAAEEAVLKLYPGEVIGTTLSGGTYFIQLRTEQGLYAMNVDADNGQIVSLDRLEVDPDATPPSLSPSASGPLTTESASTQPPSSQSPAAESPSAEPSGTPEASSTYLSAGDAGEIAAGKVPGIIKDTEYRESSKGSYYLIEIRLEDGREAYVQVNAVNGKVMSVTWDDHGGRGKDDSVKGSDDK